MQISYLQIYVQYNLLTSFIEDFFPENITNLRCHGKKSVVHKPCGSFKITQHGCFVLFFIVVYLLIFTEQGTFHLNTIYMAVKRLQELH